MVTICHIMIYCGDGTGQNLLFLYILWGWPPLYRLRSPFTGRAYVMTQLYAGAIAVMVGIAGNWEIFHFEPILTNVRGGSWVRNLYNHIYIYTHIYTYISKIILYTVLASCILVVFRWWFAREFVSWNSTMILMGCCKRWQVLAQKTKTMVVWNADVEVPGLKSQLKGLRGRTTRAGMGISWLHAWSWRT